MPPSWSARLEEQFGLTLPDDVRCWFDDELWRGSDCTDYNEAVSPAELLDPRSSAVWGGMMPPDTLPVLGNGAGDCLSLRFDANGAVSEVVCWLHEGGQWWPCGKTLSEALVLDRIRRISAPLDEKPEDESDAGNWADWATQWLGTAKIQSIGFRDSFDNPSSVYDGFLDAGVAEESVHGILCEQALDSGLMSYCRRVGGMKLANRLGVPWSHVRLWLFDNARVPPEMVARLAKETGRAPEDLLSQDWEAAAVHARFVSERRSDLAWPFAVVGWAKERKGDVSGAIEDYYAGLCALGSTAAFTDDWTLEGHWPGEKFTRARLVVLKSALPRQIREDPYLLAVFEQRDTVRKHSDAIREFWLARAEDAIKRGDAFEAYHSVYAAGWDQFHADGMDLILDRLIAAARMAGSRAWEKIAERHRQSL